MGEPNSDSMGVDTAAGVPDARYFLIRVSKESDFEDARRTNIWSTNPQYDDALRKAYTPASNVFLIFTQRLSREFCGIAKMVSEISWFGERTIFDRSRFRQKFKLQWIGCSRVPYDRITILTHTPVHSIIRRHGEELNLPIGDAIHKLLVEYLPEDQRQPTAASTVPAGITVADATATSLSQDVSMDESKQDQGDQPLHINSLPIDDSHMDADMPEPARIVFRDKEDNASDDDSSSMDLDSNPDLSRIELPSHPDTLRSESPKRGRKRSRSADGDVDWSAELASSSIKQEQPADNRGRSLERSTTQLEKDDHARVDTLSSPERYRSPSPPGPERYGGRSRSSPPPRRWSPSRNRSPPPPRHRSPPPSRRRSLPPPRNRSPPLSRRRSPPPPLSGQHYEPWTYHNPRQHQQQQQQQQQYGSSRSRSSPASSQRSKDPRNRSSSVHVFHSGIPAADPRLADYGSKRHALPPRPGQTIPQKRPHDEDGDGKMEEMDGDDVEASTASLMPSVFPLEDDDDDHFMGPAHSSAPSGSGSGSGAGPSFSAAGPSTTAPAPQIITSVTLVPAGLSKRQKKKLRKEALSKPLNF
ncbi:hypothetical protein BGX33_010205 [Mortierella sp. NVP41]|nr:hypothetical protein BGX33_010205 [Mortierella sp. NVP41]